MPVSAMWAKLLSRSLRFGVPLREGVWLFSAAWFGFFTGAEEVVCWRSHGRLETLWLQLPPQISVLEEAERKSTKLSVFGSGEFNSSCLRGKGRPMQRSSDFGQHFCCSTPPCRKLALCPCWTRGSCQCCRSHGTGGAAGRERLWFKVGSLLC